MRKSRCSLIARKRAKRRAEGKYPLETEADTVLIGAPPETPMPSDPGQCQEDHPRLPNGFPIPCFLLPFHQFRKIRPRMVKFHVQLLQVLDVLKLGLNPATSPKTWVSRKVASWFQKEKRKRNKLQNDSSCLYLSLPPSFKIHPVSCCQFTKLKL